MNKLYFPGGRAIVLGLLVLITSVCHGQTTATVTGSVTDPSGAVVPGATVTITGASTGFVSETVTNEAGVYRIAGLNLGVYKAAVSKQGFKSILKDGIELHVNDIAQINFKMEVGAVTENVTIEAGAPQIETESATLGDDIQGRQVQEVPLNGRNVMNLMELVPGIIPEGLSKGDPNSNQGSNNTAQGGFGQYQVGGALSGQNQTYVDGVSANTSGTLVGLIPSTDSVAEFRVDSNAVSPQYGAFAGGVINFSTKSGTNNFHGTAFEYVRNTVFDANSWWNDHLGGAAGGFAVPFLHQNQFGGTVGGPIVKNKAFFFFSYAATRLDTAAAQEFWVPTPAEAIGDFTADYGTTTDKIGDYWTVAQRPANGLAATQVSSTDPSTLPEACAGGGINKICPAHISPAWNHMIALKYYNPIESNATKLAALQAQGYNQSIVSHQPNNENQYVGRVDYKLTDSQQLFGRYTHWNVFIPNCDICKMPALPTQPTYFTSQNYVVGDTLTLSSSMVLNLRLGYTRWSRTQSSNGSGKFDLTQFGTNWAGIQKQLNFTAPPEWWPPNFSTWTNAPLSLDLFSTGSNNTYSILAYLTKVKGHHTLQFGGEVRRIESYSLSPGNPGGSFAAEQGASFWGAKNASGIQLGDLAEMVTGTSDFSGGFNTIGSAVPSEAYSYYQGYYVSDTWQARPKLTLTLGLRWELPGASADKHNYTTVTLANAPNPIGTIVNPVGGPTQMIGVMTEVASSLYPSKWTSQIHYGLFDPRLGIAYSINPHTAIRAGFGISHPGGGAAVAGGPLTTASTQNPTGYTSIDDPYFTGPLLQPLKRSTQLMAPYSSFPQTLLGTNIAGGPPSQTATYAEQWNLNVERSFGNNLTTTVAYVGNKSVHNGGAYSLGQLADKYDVCNSEAYPTKSSLPSQCGGYYITDQIANPLSGIASPAGPAGSAMTSAGNLLMPYPEFTGYPTSVNKGQTSYNGLLVSVKERLPSAGIVTVSYTWAQLLSNVDNGGNATGAGGIQDNYNPSADYGISSSDIPQNLALSYVTDLPVGKGKHFLANANGVLDAIVGGWGLQGVTQLQSGFPLNFSMANGGNQLSRNPFGVGTIRPNVVTGVSKKISGSRYQRVNSTWFNTNAFASPGDYAFGNESRADSTLRADSLYNWDMALVKALKFREGISLQFRAEYFNAFNHPQYGAPSTQVGAGNFGTINANTANGATNVAQPRIGQLAMRLNF